MKYSICSTTYNVAPKLRKALDSILKYTNPDDFEIVVVDSKSADGTLEILREYQEKFTNFKVVILKCKRGLGRQLAFQNSVGNYIIQVDLDTVYYASWKKLLDLYMHSEFAGTRALQVPYFGIYPRHLLAGTGGWRNLQLAEDFDLWQRLIKIDAFKWCPLVVGENWKIKEPEKRQTKSICEVIWRKFIAEKDRFIARSEYSLRDRLKECREWSTPKTYYFFWIPVVIFAKVISFPSNKERREAKRVKDKWQRNMIDFESINGERIYNFVPFPRR